MMRAKIFAGLLTALASASASAAPNFFDVSCSDRSMSDYLAPLFGSLFSECGGGAGALEKALGILNGGALTVGGIFLAYTLIVGIMQTAHDGEALGKRWSSMWLPIRTVLGIGLVVPTSGGYCVAQLLVGFLIGQGVGLADQTFNAWLGAFTTPQGMAPRARLPNVSELANAVLASQVCMAAFNDLRGEGAAANIMADPMAAATPAEGVHAYGVNGGTECGAVRFQSRGAGSKIAGWAGIEYDAGALASIDAAHRQAFAALETSMAKTAQGVAKSIHEGAAPDVAADVGAAVEAYQKSVSQAAASVYNNSQALDSFVQSAGKDGWAFAGAYYSKLAQMQDALNGAIAHTPAATRPDPRRLPPGMGIYFARLDTLATNPGGALSATASASSDLGNTSSPLAQGAREVMNSVFGGDWIASAIQADKNRSALMSVKDFGDYLMTGAEAGMGAGVLMTSAAKAVDSENNSWLGEAANVLSFGASKALAGGASGAMQAVGYMLIFACFALFFFAAGIAVYLPMAPFLIYFGAFAGWLLLCLEAVIAAPVWAIMHLMPEGDGIAGGARQGYALLLGVLLRPVLIVLGFICSMGALDLLVQGFNAIFFPAFKMAMAGSLVGLGTLITMVGIYFGAMLFLFHFVFGFITVIPDKLMRWVGGGHEQLGESAQALSKTGQGGAQGVGQSAGGAVSKGLGAVGAKAALDARRERTKGEGDPRVDAGQAMQEKKGKGEQ